MIWPIYDHNNTRLCKLYDFICVKRHLIETINNYNISKRTNKIFYFFLSKLRIADSVGTAVMDWDLHDRSISSGRAMLSW